jgi:sulfoxide reductase heme-binding subunit YedZ
VVLSPKAKVRLLKAAVWVLGLSPLAWGLYRAFLGDGFGVNPVEEIDHYTGDVTLIMLLSVLAVTPVRGLTGWNGLQKVRRLMGLFAFFWVCLHFLVWIGLDQFFAWEFIGEDLVERPYIVVGFTAFLLLLPMAVTSTRGWIRRLGKNWTRLHRALYAATLLGILHFFWITKADDRWPTRALIVWALLMAYRLPWRRLLGRASAARGAASAGAAAARAKVGAAAAPVQAADPTRLERKRSA